MDFNDLTNAKKKWIYKMQTRFKKEKKKRGGTKTGFVFLLPFISGSELRMLFPPVRSINFLNLNGFLKAGNFTSSSFKAIITHHHSDHKNFRKTTLDFFNSHWPIPTFFLYNHIQLVLLFMPASMIKYDSCCWFFFLRSFCQYQLVSPKCLK